MPGRHWTKEQRQAQAERMRNRNMPAANPPETVRSPLVVETVFDSIFVLEDNGQISEYERISHPVFRRKAQS